MSIFCPKCKKENQDDHVFCAYCGVKLEEKNLTLEEENNIIFILDRSGSMRGQEEDTIGGYNSFIENEKAKGRNTYVTTVLFDHDYEVIADHKYIQDVKELTSKEYYTRGSTALYDAIGRTIKTIEAKAKGKVLFVITTDGYENASTEYRQKDVFKMIKEHDDYEFMYIGANIDSYAAGSSIGIKRNNIANRAATREGVRKMYMSVSDANDSFVMTNEIDADWKKDLEDF